MIDLPGFRPSATFRTGLRQTIHHILDALGAATLLTVSLSITRLLQFGAAYHVMIVMLLLSAVLPMLFLRADRFLEWRAAIVISAFLIVIYTGMSQLGLLAVATAVLPFFMGVATSVFSARIGYWILVAAMTPMVAIGVLFLNGTLSPPDSSITAWNASIANWIVTLATIALFSAFNIMLIQALRRSWRETDLQAIEKYEQFEALIEYAPEAIVIIDMDQERYVMANAPAERMFGMSRTHLTSGPSPISMSPEYQPSGELSLNMALSYLKQAMQGGHPTFEWNHLNAQGEEFPCLISLSRIPPFDKKLIRSSMIDISDRIADKQRQKELQAQLAASQKMEAIGQLTGGVAHDFNNLLAVILGNLELIQEETIGAPAHDLVQPCIDATLRGADLTRSMLSFARKAPLKPCVLDLNTLVKDTKDWTSRTLPSTIDVETALSPDLWQTKTDPVAAESALINLILNARDAMTDGGTLTLETANITIDAVDINSYKEDISPGCYAMVAVTDTGSGIAANSLGRIFEPFFTTKPTGQGSGLGLSMVQGFMRQSDGAALVYSEQGIGTTFKLFFPAVQSPDQPQDQPPQAAAQHNLVPNLGLTMGPDSGSPLSSQSASKHILIAEDEPEVLRVLSAMLTTAGFRVTAAGSGDQAKSLFGNGAGFDLLLTDIVMPGRLQGTSLAHEIKQITPDLPVVFMSGYASKATVEGVELSTADIRLMKPVMRKDLLQAIENALASKARNDVSD
ncbi:MAG: response regulator [Pelagimonas sp.]|jgi:PAS domain S-box-containing protein|nr:response regulator [Pelagimonas sp.]